MATLDTGDVKSLMTELVKRINEDTRRVRTLEQKMEKIENSIRGLEDSSLVQLNELKLGLEKINDRILKTSDRLTNMENDILKLNKELGKTASKIDVKQLENFIDLVNPITSRFVTKDEMERAMEERARPKRVIFLNLKRI